MNSRLPRATTALLITVFLVSVGLWLAGLHQSPLFHPTLPKEEQYVRQYLDYHSPERLQERLLADAYWRRYPDIGADPYFGTNGTLGVAGAREHYRSYGRSEGRLFAPLPDIDCSEEEARLAEAYWRRYPDIERSPVWGRDGALGLLGPRDHYEHIGQRQGRIWGIAADTGHRPL